MDDDRRHLRTRLTLWPGQKGTKKLQARYGAKLLCVRYRYDPVRYRRYKTVELIEDEAAWAPDMSAIVAVRVEIYELELRAQVKEAGGRWDPEQKVWRLPIGQVLALGLEERLVAVAEESI